MKINGIILWRYPHFFPFFCFLLVFSSKPQFYFVYLFVSFSLFFLPPSSTIFSCPAGYRISGNHCVNENECQWFPCRNGGRCRDLAPPRRYECRCSRGYTGMNCELELLASGVITPSKDFIIALLVCLSTLIRKYFSCL